MRLQDKNASIYVAGHRGLVGSAVVRRLRAAGYTNLVLRTSDDLDLRVQADVDAFFDQEQPEYVVMAAAKVGGILANDTYPADFISDNLAIQTNVIRAAHRTGVRRLVFLGSSCIYPKHAPQPLKEEYLLTGPLEPTNQWYAIAKIAGVKLCEAYRRQHGDDFLSLMPTNLYGPGDNFDLKTSHVLPALLRKFHEAKREGLPDAPVTLWGTGTPKREFLYNADVADACLFILEQEEDRIYDVAPDGLLNVGVGEDLSIRELAERIREVVGSESPIEYDRAKPDGTPRKLLDVSRMEALGWQAPTSLDEGLRKTYAWYLDHVAVA
ncbi:MAG: NAD-dependent epimerase/dehydratase family protein [Bacteroidetes bacterium]|jgi:GDP-L-fucose synthase|nr:NAD-dependent epimerase/dehydratase family protein [Bacteroidota bacterium]